MQVVDLSEYDIEQIEAVIRLLEADLGRRHSIAALEETAGMGATRLRACFYYYTGVNLFAFVKARRLNLAYELVCFSRLPLKKIAGLAGYQHLSHFNTAFKKRFLVTAYRLRRAKRGRVKS